MPPPYPPALRILICLKPDPGVQAAIDRFRVDTGWPSWRRWTTAPRLHLTLQCWDGFPGSEVEPLRAALRGVPMAPLDLVLDKPQLWHRQTAVLLARPNAGLQALHERMRAALGQAGLLMAPHLQPHVTLSYRAPEPPPADAGPGIPWCAREFLLIWSQLPPAYPRAHHEVLQRYGAAEASPAA
ncbi:2'-5' RNA ligase family protein [Variovorax terrae]|uniref:2'-5' RNA ligase family protein n=1 Tax=Variovorax terrae TaxID=2923278 RepID=A0A9X1VT94_9BURK|nr:2'-5' RNA ligase family protein [Variovorax terrae]MCJ0763501.1 2'-5' RNA ligase family protein [Variovorax terrae]